MKNKKIIYLLFGLLMLFALVGCDNNNHDSDDTITVYDAAYYNDNVACDNLIGYSVVTSIKFGSEEVSNKTVVVSATEEGFLRSETITSIGQLGEEDESSSSSETISTITNPITIEWSNDDFAEMTTTKGNFTGTLKATSSEAVIGVANVEAVIKLGVNTDNKILNISIEYSQDSFMTQIIGNYNY